MPNPTQRKHSIWKTIMRHTSTEFKLVEWNVLSNKDEPQQIELLNCMLPSDFQILKIWVAIWYLVRKLQHQWMIQHWSNHATNYVIISNTSLHLHLLYLLLCFWFSFSWFSTLLKHPKLLFFSCFSIWNPVSEILWSIMDCTF